MNERIDKLMYHAGLTAQGCWDEMDEYDRKAIEKFAELIVQECANLCKSEWNGDADTYLASEAYNECAEAIKEHFGVEE